MLRSSDDCYRRFGQPMGLIFEGQVVRRCDYHLRCATAEKMRRSHEAGYCAPGTNVAFIYKRGVIQ